MTIEQTIDLSNDQTISTSISNTRFTYTIEFDGRDGKIEIILDKSQMRSLLEDLVDEELIVVDEDGEIQVEV